MENPILDIVVPYLCLLFSLCVHEAAHAAMANRCGDPSARLMGRLTLNPIAHIDPIGTVLLPVMMMVFGQISGGPRFLFGWAKPVPFNPRNLRNMRRDPVLIAMAGPASNVLLAVFFALLLRLMITFATWGVLDIGVLELIMPFFMTMITINLILMLFNLIPVPPLDGHYLLGYFLPASGQRVLEQIGPFGIIIAIFAARPVFAVGMPILNHAVSFVIFFGHG